MTWVGSIPLPPASCTTTFRRKYFRKLTVADHTKKNRRPLLRAETSVGSISAHDIASGSLASSEKGAEDAGAPPGSAFRPSFVLPSAHHWRIPFWPSSSSSDHYFPGAAIAPQPPLETVDCPSDHGFSRQYLWLQSQDHRTPLTTAQTPRPELHRHLSFATRAPSSPELRRPLSFSTRASPSPEFHLSAELRRHLSLRLKLYLHHSFAVT